MANKPITQSAGNGSSVATATAPASVAPSVPPVTPVAPVAAEESALVHVSGTFLPDTQFSSAAPGTAWRSAQNPAAVFVAELTESGRKRYAALGSWGATFDLDASLADSGLHAEALSYLRLTTKDGIPVNSHVLLIVATAPEDGGGEESKYLYPVKIGALAPTIDRVAGKLSRQGRRGLVVSFFRDSEPVLDGEGKQAVDGNGKPVRRHFWATHRVEAFAPVRKVSTR